MRIAGIIPAAGRSSRLGIDKLLVDLEGEPLVRRAARRAIAAGLAPVIVVVRDASHMSAALSGLPVQLVPNPRPEDGMASSVHAGIGAVPAECDAAVVLLPDMPLVTAKMLTELCERYTADRAPLVITVYGETAAPPTLFARSLFSVLASAAEGGRQVVREHRSRAAIVRQPAALLVDVDLPADLHRVRGADSAG